MHIVLYALSAVVVIVAVVISLVAVRRSQQGLELDLEVTASGRLDTLLVREEPTERSSYSTAA
jgi:hypothetical protein